MSEGQAVDTRAVSLTSDDLADLREKLESKSFDGREEELIRYLTEQAEMGMNESTSSDPLWTWTYRF